jgi:hypothetical protein
MSLSKAACPTSMKSIPNGELLMTGALKGSKNPPIARSRNLYIGSDALKIQSGIGIAMSALILE